LSGNEEKDYWNIRLIIDRSGNIKYNGHIRIEVAEERKILHNKNYNEHIEDRREWHKEYYRQNRDMFVRNSKKYNFHHKENISLKGKTYRTDHRDELIEKSRNYNRIHKKEQAVKKKEYAEKNNFHLKEIQKKYYIVHKIELLEYKKSYQQSEKGKVVRKRTYNRRKRNLGFIPLNEPIEGIECDAHHINNDDVIYTPRIIHKNVPHNLKTDKNIKLINSIAYSFL